MSLRRTRPVRLHPNPTSGDVGFCVMLDPELDLLDRGLVGSENSAGRSRPVVKQVFLVAPHQADRQLSKTAPFLYGKPGRIEHLYEYPPLEVFRYMLVAMPRSAAITVGTRAWLA